MRNLLAALFFFLASAAPGAGQTLVGNKIHNFTLPDLNGTFRSPSQYRGKILGIFLLGHD